jgi:hypothetical protein
MITTVFYSWQSDRPPDLCRYLIRDAAQEALKPLTPAAAFDPSPRLDHDTQGEAGMPELAATILEKIQRAGFFLADVTFVGSTPAAEGERPKLLPNPNVPLELGFAARALGWDRIVCVMNEAFGPREEQIFNVRHRRLPITYTLRDRAERGAVLPNLARKIKDAVAALMWVQHHGVEAAVARLDVPCLVFLRQYAKRHHAVGQPPFRAHEPGLLAVDLLPRSLPHDPV